MDEPSEPKKYLTFKGIRYQYTDRHYHFGSNDNEGSPHALFGKKFPLEVHNNFYNSKYERIQQASGFPDGTLTLVEFYQVDMRTLVNIVNWNETVTIKTGSTLSSLIPINSKFYYYTGSSTEPNCYEGTIYVIFNEIQSVSVNQMARFRNVLRTSMGIKLIKNWRFLQPRNGRKIYFSSKNVPSSSSFEFDEIVNVVNG